MIDLFEPELERCLFRERAFAERLFDGVLSERQLALVEYAPKRVLVELSRERWHTEDRDHAELLRRLAKLDLTALTQEPAIRDLLRFVGTVRERSAA